MFMEMEIYSPENPEPIIDCDGYYLRDEEEE